LLFTNTNVTLPLGVKLGLSHPAKNKPKTLHKRMLRKMFGPNMEGKQETGENYLVRSFIICTADQGRHVARMG
jgi:hypothetical protein